LINTQADSDDYEEEDGEVNPTPLMRKTRGGEPYTSHFTRRRRKGTPHPWKRRKM